MTEERRVNVAKQVQHLVYGEQDIPQENKERLNTIIDLTYQRVMGKIPKPLELPEHLDYIVVELSVARFNRVGSEGMSTEAMQDYSATYMDNDLSNYQRDIDNWLESEGYLGRKRGGIRAL